MPLQNVLSYEYLYGLPECNGLTNAKPNPVSSVQDLFGTSKWDFSCGKICEEPLVERLTNNDKIP